LCGTAMNDDYLNCLTFVVRLHDMHNKYVGKVFVRTPFKTRNEKLFETFHKINRRDAEDLVLEFEKGIEKREKS